MIDSPVQCGGSRFLSSLGDGRLRSIRREIRWSGSGNGSGGSRNYTLLPTSFPFSPFAGSRFRRESFSSGCSRMTLGRRRRRRRRGGKPLHPQPPHSSPPQSIWKMKPKLRRRRRRRRSITFWRGGRSERIGNHFLSSRPSFSCSRYIRRGRGMGSKFPLTPGWGPRRRGLIGSRAGGLAAVGDSDGGDLDGDEGGFREMAAASERRDRWDEPVLRVSAGSSDF
jgi:hypothetical protein